MHTYTHTHTHTNAHTDAYLHTHTHTLTHTQMHIVMQNIGTPALLSDNASLLPENCCNYKCFVIHMCISIVCIGTTQKSREEKPTPKMDWTK